MKRKSQTALKSFYDFIEKSSRNLWTLEFARLKFGKAFKKILGIPQSFNQLNKYPIVYQL